MSQQQRVVLIGQDDQGKTALTSAIEDVLGEQTNIELVDIEWFSGTLEIKDIKVAKGALLVVSALDGPMPKTREHLGLVKEAEKKVICVFLSQVDMVDDEDLLELTELEVRELLNSYGFSGDDMPIVRGSAPETLRTLKKKLGG